MHLQNENINTMYTFMPVIYGTSFLETKTNDD